MFQVHFHLLQYLLLHVIRGFLLVITKIIDLMFYEDKNERFTVSFFSIPPPGHTQHDGNVRI